MVEDAFGRSLWCCLQDVRKQSLCLSCCMGKHDAASWFEIRRWAGEFGASFRMEIDESFRRVAVILVRNCSICLSLGGFRDRFREMRRRGTVFCGAMFRSEERRGELGLVKLRFWFLWMRVRLDLGHRGAT